MTQEELKEWREDYENKQLSADAYILFQNMYIMELEKAYSDLDYKFSCILDHATGSRASKTNIDTEMAYKLIDEHVNFWVDSAVAELEAMS